MLSHFFPKNRLFFTLFNQFAEEVHASAELLRRGISGEVPLQEIPALRRERKNAANALRKELFTLTHKTFITPFDRNDIHSLNKELYRGCSTALSVLARFVVYDLKTPTPAMLQMSLICESAAAAVVSIVKNIEHLGNASAILESCLEIKRYESAADALLLTGLSTLFQTENDTKTLLKCREIYEALEKITDYYLQIAFVIEGIVLEYS